MAAPDARAAEHKYLQIQQFRTVNTQPSRTAIEQDEFSWLENLMPIGDAFAPVVPGPRTFASLNAGTATNIIAVAPSSGGGTEFWAGAGAATVTAATAEVPITWDAATKHAGYSVSADTLTVTVTDDGGSRIANSSIRATTAFSSGKKYIEIDSDCSHVSQYGAVGLATGALSANNYVGETNASWGYFTSGGLFHNAANIGTFGAWVSFQPAWHAIAVDFDAGKAWFAMEQFGASSQVWQGGGDPAAGTNPAFTFAPGISLYPAWTGAENTDYATITSTTPAFHFAPPTGFTSWATP